MKKSPKIKKAKKETLLEIVARTVVKIDSDLEVVRTDLSHVKRRVDIMDKRLETMDDKLDSVKFHHERRLELLEDDVRQIKTFVFKK